MHDKAPATRRGHRFHEAVHEGIILMPVDTDAMLDRDRHGHHGLHGGHAVGHTLRLGHQAGPEGPLPHPVAGAAAVQVDLIVPVGHAFPGRMRQQLRVIAPQLQHHPFPLLAPAQQMAQITMCNGLGRDHFGVQPCLT